MKKMSFSMTAMWRTEKSHQWRIFYEDIFNEDGIVMKEFFLFNI